MSTHLNPLSGDEKDTVVAEAERTSEFQAYHDYFVDQLKYNIAEIDVVEERRHQDDNEYMISFRLDDDRPDTNAGFDILLEDYNVVESSASIDHYEDGEIIAVDEFSYQDGQIKQRYHDLSTSSTW